MKNLKVGKKFIVSFGSILILFLVSVVVGTIGIARARASYRDFYSYDYKAVSSVYEIQLKMQGALKELMLAVMESDPAEKAQRVGTVNENMDLVHDELDSIFASYKGDVSLLREFESGLDANKATRLQIIDYINQNTPESNAAAQALVLTEYNPQIENFVETLERAFVQMGRASQTSYQEAMSLQSMLIAVTVAVAAVAFLLTVFIALNLTGNILIPVKKIQAAMVEVAKGSLSVDIDYTSGRSEERRVGKECL